MAVVALAIFVISLSARHDITDAFVNIVTSTYIDDRKDLDSSDVPVLDSAASRMSAASGDVNCTATDDVTACRRRSLCPAYCTCGPLNAGSRQLNIDCRNGTTCKSATVNQSIY